MPNDSQPLHSSDISPFHAARNLITHQSVDVNFLEDSREMSEGAHYLLREGCYHFFGQLPLAA